MFGNNHNKLNKFIVALGFIWLIFASPNAASAAMSEIELMDGSVIQGEIISFAGGIYKVHSSVLGAISLPEGKIRRIQPLRSTREETLTQNPGASPVQNIDQIQQQMMNDPETVKLIQELQNDPSVQKILEDPELMEAIAQGNLNRVSEDPRIQALMQNQKVGKIIEKNQ